MNAIATDAIGELREIIGVSRAARAVRSGPFELLLPTGSQGSTPTTRWWTQPNALGEDEQAPILDVLHSDAHVDHSPYDVFAALLDEGTYLASIRSFYRVLEKNGETTTRTNQRKSTGPRPIPVLCARRPNEIWTLGYFADCDDHEEEVLLPLCGDRHLQPLRSGLVRRGGRG